MISVKPLSVKILSKPAILETEKDYSIACETVGSHPRARIAWMEGNSIYHSGKVNTAIDNRERIVRRASRSS